MRRILPLILALVLLLCPQLSLAEDGFDEARAIANFMETHYGLTILIGPECKDITGDFFTVGDQPGGRTPFQKLLGGKDYAREIRMIDDAFSIYASGFFERFPCEQFLEGLRLLLADQILYEDISVAGVTFLKDGYCNIMLGVGSFLEKNIHHELWHAMEYRIEAENPHTFDRWNELNPEGFEYDWDHHTEMNPWEQAADLDEWFARGYSTIADYEDRATVIEAFLYKSQDWWAAHPGVAAKFDFMMEAAKPIFGTIYDQGE